MNPQGKQYVIGLASYPYQAPESVFTYFETTLTSAQILDLFTTPIELIAAPSATEVISITKAIVTLKYGTATYVSAGNLNITQGSNNMAQFGATVIAATADKTSQVLSSSATLTPGTAVDIKVTGANPTTGDGELKVQLWYNVVQL